MEKKLDGNYTRMLLAILNKSWRQHPAKEQLYGYLPIIMKLSKLDEPDIMWYTAREVGTNSQVTYSGGTLHMEEQRQEPIYNSSVLIQDVALRTYRVRWTIERGSRRESERSILVAQHDGDDIYRERERKRKRERLID